MQACTIPSYLSIQSRGAQIEKSKKHFNKRKKEKTRQINSTEKANAINYWRTANSVVV